MSSKRSVRQGPFYSQQVIMSSFLLTIKERVRSGIPVSFTQASITPWISAVIVEPASENKSHVDHEGNHDLTEAVMDKSRQRLQLKTYIKEQFASLFWGKESAGDFKYTAPLETYYGNKKPCTWFVNDSIYFLNHIEVGLVVGVLYASPSPGYHRQLPSGELFSYIGTSWKDLLLINSPFLQGDQGGIHDCFRLSFILITTLQVSLAAGA